MRNAAIIFSIWQRDTQKGQVRGQDVPLRSKELGGSPRETQVAADLVTLPVSGQCLFS